MKIFDFLTSKKIGKVTKQRKTSELTFFSSIDASNCVFSVSTINNLTQDIDNNKSCRLLLIHLDCHFKATFTQEQNRRTESFFTSINKVHRTKKKKT